FLIIAQTVASSTQDELAQDPTDFFANFLLHTANHIAIGGQLFAALYLLSHGIIKIFLVIALLKNKLWAYPLSLGVLGLFIVYQVYRFTDTHSIGLVVLTVFDAIVIWLIWKEYQLVRAHLVPHEAPVV